MIREKKQSKVSGYSERLSGVRAFARKCRYEVRHSEQVKRLAERLFDGLKHSFNLSQEHRFWLATGAILHDIGWVDGQQKHHKTSMRMILSNTTMMLDENEQQMAALIARYHRRSLPKSKHSVYGELSENQQALVRLLAGIVRLADGLDRTHTESIDDLTVQLESDKIIIVCKSKVDVKSDIDFGKQKADLLELATGCTVEISAAVNE